MNNEIKMIPFLVIQCREQQILACTGITTCLCLDIRVIHKKGNNKTKQKLIKWRNTEKNEIETVAVF